jgi:serine/threonine-protein kinase haspin
MDTVGVAVTLIDFTLSRLDTGAGTVAFCDLSADPDLFKGPKNDCQASEKRLGHRCGLGGVAHSAAACF